MTEQTPDAPETVRPPLSRRARTAIRLLSTLAVLLLAACVALAVIVKGNVDDRDTLREARAGALAAARQQVINLDSLSAATIDRDLKRVLDGATGTFKDQFTRSQADLKALIVERKTVSSASIISSGIVRADTGTATVLVAVDRTVKDTTTPQGAVAHDRWRVDLEWRDGRWLVAELEPVA